MDAANLVRMANRIADFFRYQGGEDEACAAIAAHLHHFWSLAMRLALIEAIERGDAADPLVRAAVVRFAARLASPTARVPSEEQLDLPVGGGDAG